MKFSNNNSDYSAYEAYGVSKEWDITNATYGGTSSDGAKTVYVIYKDSLDNEAIAISDSITYDTIAPTLSEITVVTTPTADTTPDYTFNTDEAGDITYGGSCLGLSTSTASSGNNAVSFNALTNDTYSDCTVIVTDTVGNASDALSITSFTIASPRITITESNNSTAIEEGSTMVRIGTAVFAE